jgi:ABC-2 type transport system ATP-binding protein
LLKISELNFSYDSQDKPLLHQLSLDMEAGDILGLLGPNGAGKTSLASLITGILKASSGQILIDGTPARLGRSDIALVPQEYAFYQRLSGRENLRYFAGIIGLKGTAAKAAVAKALAGCELNEVADRRAGLYSGGLKRRLNFAIALLQQPRLLILDEPTAGVDPHSRSFLLDLVRQQNRAGVSVIYTSHLLDEVQALCNRIVVMDRGEVLMQGSTDKLLAENARLLTVVLAEPIDPALAQRLKATLIDDYRIRFDLILSQSTPAQILRQLEEADCQIRRLSYGERRLEELFFELTRRELRD